MNWKLACAVLETREGGVKLCQGPWQYVSAGKWLVPVVGYMSLCRLSDYLVSEDGKAYKLIRGLGVKPASDSTHQKAGRLDVSGNL